MKALVGWKKSSGNLTCPENECGRAICVRYAGMYSQCTATYARYTNGNPIAVGDACARFIACSV